MKLKNITEWKKTSKLVSSSFQLTELAYSSYSAVGKGRGSLITSRSVELENRVLNIKHLLPYFPKINSFASFFKWKVFQFDLELQWFVFHILNTKVCNVTPSYVADEKTAYAKISKNLLLLSGDQLSDRDRHIKHGFFIIKYNKLTLQMVVSTLLIWLLLMCSPLWCVLMVSAVSEDTGTSQCFLKVCFI